MRELEHLVVSEFHLRALFVGLGILLGFNYGIQYKPSMVSFIATIGSSGPTLSLPAAPSNYIIPIQAEYFFPSRSVSASYQTSPTSTTILSSSTTSTLHWFVPSQANWNPRTDSNSISGLFELSSPPVSKSFFSEPACNSTLGSSKGRQLCQSSRQEAIRPYFVALIRVFVARRLPQNAPRPKGEVKEGFTDLILHPSYTTSASQEQGSGIPGWNVQATSEFGLVEILVLPILLAVLIRFTVHIVLVIVSTVLDLVIGSVPLCAYSTRACRAILVFLNFPQVPPLELSRRQGRLRARHRKKGILPPNATSASLLPLATLRTFLYAPEQLVTLEHVILHDKNASTSIPSSNDLYDPRYLVIVEILGNSGSGRVCIVKNFKKKDEADAEGGQLVLETVSRYHGGYRLLQFAQELRALYRLQESLWCPKLVASFAGPENLHMLMPYYPRGHLADFIGEAGGRLSRVQAKFYLVELFIAIRAIHKMGVFHHEIDLKNLFLTGSGHLVVSDFHKAKINYDVNRPTEDEIFQTAISQDAFRDYYAMIKVYYKMVTGNPLNAIHFKRMSYHITKAENSFFKLLLKPFSENRELPSPMDMQKHTIFDRINWDAMEKQLIAVPASSRSTSIEGVGNEGEGVVHFGV